MCFRRLTTDLPNLSRRFSLIRLWRIGIFLLLVIGVIPLSLTALPPFWASTIRFFIFSFVFVLILLAILPYTLWQFARRITLERKERRWSFVFHKPTKKELLPYGSLTVAVIVFLIATIINPFPTLVLGTQTLRFPATLCTGTFEAPQNAANLPDDLSSAYRGGTAFLHCTKFQGQPTGVLEGVQAVIRMGIKEVNEESEGAAGQEVKIAENSLDQYIKVTVKKDKEILAEETIAASPGDSDLFFLFTPEVSGSSHLRGVRQNTPREAVLSWEDLENIEVIIEGLRGGGPSASSPLEAFVDSIWLEVSYRQPKTEGETPKITGKKAPQFLTLLKKNFKATEAVEFTVEKEKAENLGEQITGSRYQFQLRNPDGDRNKDKEKELRRSKGEEGGKAKFSFIPQKPGRYTLKYVRKVGGVIIENEQDFTWGVLAINTNKSIYLPSDNAYIQMGALTDAGHTICNANLRLEIEAVAEATSEVKSSNTSEVLTIKRSKECGGTTVTNTPDYFAYYPIKEPGTYEMVLTNLDNGYSITDFFEVHESVPFDIERVGPSRIYPPAVYKMTLKIKANEDFKGEVVETVPNNFEIKGNELRIMNNGENKSIPHTSSPIIQEREDGKKKLVWQNINLNRGDELEIRYTFDAPDISPYLYLLGPLTLSTPEVYPVQHLRGVIFREARRWQIAADAINLVQTINYAIDDVLSISATFGTAATINNLLIAICANDSSVTTTGPSGFSTAINQSANVPGQAIFYKVAAGGETTLTCSFSASTDAGIHIYEYSGMATTSPLDGTPGSATGTSATPSSGSVITANPNDLLIAGVVMDGVATTFSAWSDSFTERNDFQIGGGPTDRTTFGGADRIVTATGTYSTTATAGAPGAWRGQIAAFKEKPDSWTGRVYSDDNEATPLSSVSICAAVNATEAGCNPTDVNGVFTIDATTDANAGDQLTFYIDGGTTFGNSVTISDGFNILTADNLRVYQNHVLVRYEQGTDVSIIDMDAYDNDQNPTDMLYDAEDLATDTLVVESGIELFVYNSYILDPDGTVTTNGTGGNLEVDDSADAILDTAPNTIADDVIVGAIGTMYFNADTNVNGGAITTSGDGAISTFAGTPTVTVLGTGNIGGGTGSITFYNLNLGDNTETGTTTAASNFTVANVFTIAGATNMHIFNGGTAKTVTLSGTTGTPFVITGTFTPNTGTIKYTGNYTGGNTTVTTTAYYNLEVANSAETYYASGAVTTNGNVTVTAGTLDLNNQDMTVNGGTVSVLGTLLGKDPATSCNQFADLILSGTGNLGGTGTTTLCNLTVSGSTQTTTLSGNVTLHIGDGGSGNLTIGTGHILSGTYNVTVNGGDATGDGTITLTGGTFTLEGAGSFGGATGWTFENLTFGGDANVEATSATGSGGVTVNGVLTVGANQTLNAGSKTWTLTGAGTPLVKTGTLNAETSTFKYTSPGEGGGEKKITKLEQQINIIDQEYSCASGGGACTVDFYEPADNSLGLIKWDGTKYTGEAVYFEAIIYTSDATGCPGTREAEAALFTSSGTLITGSTVSTCSTSYARVRSGDITANLTNNTNYTARIWNNSATGISTYIKSARLIVVQSDATAITATETQVEVGENFNTINTTYMPLTNYKRYRWDANRFSGTTSVYFEASLKASSSGYTSYAALSLSSTCASIVTGSEVSVTGTTWALQRTASAITSNLTDDTDYIVCVKVTDGATSYIANAKIIIDQSDTNGLTKTQIIHQYNNTLATDADATYTAKDFDNQINPSNFSGTDFSAYFESTLKTSAGTGYARLTDGTNPIANTELTVTDTSYVRKRGTNIWNDLPTATDPPSGVVFFSGYEGGDSNLCDGGDGWDSGSCSGGATIVGNATAQVYSGTYSAKATSVSGGEANAYTDDGGGMSTVYVRFYFYLDTETLGSGNEQHLGYLWDSSWGVNANYAILQQDSSGNLELGMKDAAGNYYWAGSDGYIQTDQWYVIESKVYANSSSGTLDMWLDGDNIVSETGKNTGSNPSYYKTLGFNYSGTTGNEAYYDNVVVDDAYIGPVGWRAQIDVELKNAATNTTSSSTSWLIIQAGDQLGPTNIDNASDFGLMAGAGRQVVRTSGGTLYAVLHDFGSPPRVEVWKSYDGSSWEQRDSADSPTCVHQCFDVAIAIDNNNDIHILWTDYEAAGAEFDAYEDLEYITFATSSDQFGTQTTIRDPALNIGIGWEGISIDSNNKPHIVWQESTNVYYSNKVGASWKSPVTIESISVVGHSIAISEDNIPEISYINYTDDDLTVALGNANDAASFTLYDVDTLVNDVANQLGTSIAVDQNGNTWIAYIDSDNYTTLAKHNDGDPWTTWTIDISNSANNVGYEPSIAINGRDIYVFYREDAADIAYDKYDSAAATWAGETILHVGTYQDAKAKWAFEWNNFGPNRIDYLFSNGTDVFWSYLDLRRMPVNVDDASDFGGMPGAGRQVVRTSTGVLYAVLNDGGSCEVWKSTDGGNSWDEKDSANNPTCDGAGLAVAIDGDNVLHLAYSASQEVRYVTFSSSSDTFGTSVQIASSELSGILYLDISVDSNNAPHVIYQWWYPVGYALYYRNKTGGSWQTAVQIASVETNQGSIAINEDNIPEIAYIDASDDDLTAGVGDDNNPDTAAQWTLYDVDTLVNDVANQRGASIAVDSSGNTWIAYVDEDGTDDYTTLAKHDDASSWTTGWTTEITNGNVGYEPSLAIDGTDIYVFYEDDQDDIVYDKYTTSWAGEKILEMHNALQDVKARWAYYNNASYTTYGIDYLYSTGTTGDVFYNRLEFAGGGAGGTVNITVAIYNNLELSPSAAGGPTYALGLGTIQTTGYLKNGDGTYPVTVTAATNNTILNIDSYFTISAEAVFTASSTAAFNVAGNWTNSGTFNNNSGTVEFDGSGTSVISGATTWSSLTSDTAGKILEFAATTTQVINGVLTITGASGNQIRIDSATNTVQWVVNHQGTENVTYAYIQDSGCHASSTQITLDSTSTNGGNNGSCWVFPGVNNPPNNPSALTQKKTDDTVIAQAGWTNETSVKFTATASDPDASDTLYLCVEKDLIGTVFSGTEDLCGTGVAYSGTPVTVTVTISGQTDNSEYHWQARVKDAANDYSSWVSYGTNTDPNDRDYGIDTSAPTISSAYVYDGTGADIDEQDSMTQLDANWGGFDASVSDLNHYDYKLTRSSDGQCWNAGTNAWAACDVWNNNSTGTTVNLTQPPSNLDLRTGAMYVFSVRAIDNATNTSSTVSSDGVQINPTLTFSVGTTSIDIGTLQPGGSPLSNTSTLSITTNAYNGYEIKTFRASTFSFDGNTIDDIGCSYSSPCTWPGDGFGYGVNYEHGPSASEDCNVNSGLFWTSTDCTGTQKFAAFTTPGPGDTAADFAGPITGADTTHNDLVIKYQAEAGSTQAAGTYSVTIRYVAIPQY